MKKLSTRQQGILDFIHSYLSEHSYPPSIRDIQAACGISSTSVVDYNLQILQRDGYIRRSPEVSRGLELVGAERHVATAGATVPILGYIAAGSPLPFPDEGTSRHEPMETLALPPEMTPRRADELYALRVRGLSMIDALIDDGDVVVLRATADVLRVKRSQRAETIAGEAGVNMLLPGVLVMAATVLIMLGPFVLNFMISGFDM